MTHQELLDDISRTSIKLLMTEPFYGHFFTGIVKSVTTEAEEEMGLNTAFVRALNNFTVQFSVSKSFWLSIPAEQRYGVVKHEILHVVLKHITYNRTMKMPDRELANIAFDMVINQYIERDQLPDGGVFYTDFKKIADRLSIDFLPEESADYYYAKLSEMLDKTLSSTVKIDSNLDTDNTQRSLRELLDSGKLSTKNHKLWDTFEKLSSPERMLLEGYIDQVLKNTIERVGEGNMQGNLPGDVLEQINILKAKLKPSIDWRRALRLFTTTGSRTYLKNTMKRKSKRYGTTPGIKIKSKNHVMVAVDTSGSMSKQEIELLFGEVYHIWKNGAEMTVVEFDTIIHNVYSYQGVPPKEVKGRGGTCFDEVIRLANDKIRPDVTVFFTDGYADKIRVNPRKPLMWMITPQGVSQGSREWNQLKGRVIKMMA
ncbi:vWA domain-containing protein [Aureibacter tunicatorum]|uniref:Metal-dependent peptidase n=1 Tax=Aureibacter tunicatorum TaxID=866807 RepID=A0AAE4BTQ0_9BACT|nr:VWA-like domain-containing protein [Aureibacter tunicatorum]MDR6239877.1 putative metal-dependent peptidase [Aureibacter tunicatorum]BDD04352.1 hypothetical protein AUTU_18350 [Aureibacter tunicatorum]